MAAASFSSWRRFYSGRAIISWNDIPAFILPSPGLVLFRFEQTVLDGSLLLHSAVTLFEVLIGLLIGGTLATILGYLLARSRLLEKLVSPYLVASQAIPVVAIAPLLVIWFGAGYHLQNPGMQPDCILPDADQHHCWPAGCSPKTCAT